MLSYRTFGPRDCLGKAGTETSEKMKFFARLPRRSQLFIHTIHALGLTIGTAKLRSIPTKIPQILPDLLKGAVLLIIPKILIHKVKKIVTYTLGQILVPKKYQKIY